MPVKLVISPGTIYGGWTVLQEEPPRGKRRYFLCRCRCGREKPVLLDLLRSSGSTQCINCGTTRHGWDGTRTHRAWIAMRQRCYNPHNASFPHYGGRGIRVYTPWLEFENFLADMGAMPDTARSLDRIHGDVGYVPGNCRWADDSTQGRNRQDIHLIPYLGRIRPLVEWAASLGCRPGVLRKRLSSGWSIEQALTEPVRHGKGTPRKLKW